MQQISGGNTMIRKIIQIDEEKCNGCGACASCLLYTSEYWEEMETNVNGESIPVKYWYSDESKNLSLIHI